MNKLHRWLCLLLILCSVGIVSAQNCDPYLPCGPLPWSLPSLPDLSSPTALPAQAASGPGTPTATAVSSGLIIATSTPPFSVDELNNSVGTLQALANATSMPIYDLTGTPVNTDQSIATLTANTSTAFSYIRGLSSISFGPLTPLVTLTFTAIFLFIAFNIVGFLFPFVMAIFGVIRKAVELVLEFLPF